MKKIIVTLHFLLLFSLFFLSTKETHAQQYNCNPNTTTCDWLHVRFYNNNEGTTWEVRYKYYFKVGVVDKSYPSTSTKSIMVSPNSATSGPAVYMPTSYYGYYVNWSTTCVDPPAFPNYYSNRVDGIPQYFWNIYIDPRRNKGNQSIGNGQNLGTVGWTGGSNTFRAGSTAKCNNTPPPKPCPEPKRPKAGWCGTKTNSCGNSKTWKCSGVLDCQNHRCVCPEPSKPVGWECGTKKNKCGNRKTWTCTGANEGCENHQCVPNRFEISGNVWVDENYSGGTQQAEKDNDIEGATVRTSNNNKSNITNEDGEYVLDGFAPGTYTIQVNNPSANDYVVETNPRDIAVPPDKNSVDFRLTRRFSISGGIFTNTDTNRSRKSASETYRASQTVEISKLTGGVPSSSYTTQAVNSGTSGFTINNLMPGNYRIKYTSFPASGFLMTYPSGASTVDERIFDVSVGLGRAGTTKCKENHVQAECQDGNITALNFGIEAQSVSSWYQTVGGNARIDSGITNVVHDGAGATCSSSTEGYMSASNASLLLNDPGIVLSGKNVKIRTSAGTQESRASSRGWMIKNRPFKPAKGSNIRTSYEYLKQNIQKGGVAINAIYNPGNPCDGQNRPICEWSGNFAKGVYISTTDAGAESEDQTPLSLTIENPGTDDDTEVYNFDSGNTASKKNYIFLVGGDLRIERNINVDNGDTVIFAVKGDIVVTNNVTRIEGIYSAGGDFIVQGSGAPGDSALTVEGSIVANASPDDTAVEGGSFTSTKNLGSGATTGNAVCPAVKVVWRPDFILNAPDALKVRNSIVKEVSSDSPIIDVTNPPTPDPTASPTPTPNMVLAYRPDQAGDDIIIQAEETHSRIANNGRSWVTANSWPNGTGTNSNYIRVQPDTGGNVAPPNYVSNSPVAIYRIYLSPSWNPNQFPKTYYVNLRGNAFEDPADMAHVQPDSGTQNLGENIAFLTQSGSGNWFWAHRVDNSASGSRAKITFYGSGLHELKIYMRKDGLKIDKIVLRPESDTAVPSGNGPTPNTPEVLVAEN